MEWLNYHHLLYFWTVAKNGSVTRASKELRLAQPTISSQIHQLEAMLGTKLFARRGRELALTEAGRTAFGYADEIFSLGQEFLDSMKGQPGAARMRLVVGISEALAKSIAYQMLEPAFRMDPRIRVVCRQERSIEGFMGELAAHTVDVVLSDAPVGSSLPVKAYSHLLGGCGTTFLASPQLARSYRKRFPASLDGAPFLVPAVDSANRRALIEWFETVGVRPTIVAELDDLALAEIFGEAGLGVFAVPDVVEKEVRRRFKVHVVGHTDDLPHRFYAISLERKIRHAAVLAICDVARKHIFA